MPFDKGSTDVTGKAGGVVNPWNINYYEIKILKHSIYVREQLLSGGLLTGVNNKTTVSHGHGGGDLFMLI